MDNIIKEKNVLEDFGPVTLALTDFFFDEKMVKINTFVSKEGGGREFPVCYQMNKEELPDFILQAEDWEMVLKLNDVPPWGGDKQMSFYSRILYGENGDVVSLRFQPLVIKDIYMVD